MRVVYAKYQYRILRVADFQRELEAYTGHRGRSSSRTGSTGRPDRLVRREGRAGPAQHARGAARPATCVVRHRCTAGSTGSRARCKVTVLLHQKADYNEQTVLGFCLDGGDGLPDPHPDPAARCGRSARRPADRDRDAAATTACASRFSCPASRRRSPSIRIRSWSTATRRTTSGSRRSASASRRSTPCSTRPT